MGKRRIGNKNLIKNSIWTIIMLSIREIVDYMVVIHHIEVDILKELIKVINITIVKMLFSRFELIKVRML